VATHRIRFGSYGTNGFHLPFSDNSTAAALGTDTSSNGNTWTVNNISVTAGAGNDSLVDSPTNGSQVDTGVGGEVVGNYCTLNPLDGNPSLGWTNGNLDVPAPSNAWRTGSSTIGVTSGKWYWEVLHTGTPGGNQGVVGIVKSGYGSGQLGGDNSGFGYYTSGEKTGTGTNFAYGAAWTTNDVIGVAFDADNGTLTFYKNNASQGVAWTGITGGPWMPAVSVYAISLSYNFGQRQWAYAAPAGFKALCTTNLPTPVVAKGSTAMDVKLYTGNAGTQSITGLGFNPDLVWIKGRNATPWHAIFDSVRGTGLRLSSNVTNAETGNGSTDLLQSFDSGGFTVNTTLNGTPGDTSVNWDGSGGAASSYVAWTWDAGSSTVTNTQGSITSTVSVRANPSAGFSIVGYSGASGGGSWGHGLGVEPIFIIFKRRNAGQNWFVFHKTTGSWRIFEGLNNTNADSDYSGSMSASSTVVTLPSIAEFTTDPSSNYIAYCFAPVAGYSSAFSYTGNGSSDGPMVWLGFRPRWILLKRTDDLSDWVLHDTARDAFNVGDKTLYPNLSDAEFTVARLDELSNGFKLRSTSVTTNASGGTYIGFAFAEHPFATSRAR
jgi:hypothetical protein